MENEYFELYLNREEIIKGNIEHRSVLATFDRRYYSERSAQKILAQAKAYWMMPQLTDDRLAQLRRLQRRYERIQTDFWLQPSLMLIRDEIDIFAKQDGVSAQEIIFHMHPEGQRADLYQHFNDTVNTSAAAVHNKIDMNKLLRAWITQYCHAQKECVHPQSSRILRDKSQREQFEALVDNMEVTVRDMPAFDDALSHFDEVRCCAFEAITRIETNLLLVTAKPRL